MADEWLTMAQVCALVGKPSRRTTQIWLKRHRIEAYRHPVDGRVNLYKRADIELALASPGKRGHEIER